MVRPVDRVARSCDAGRGFAPIQLSAVWVTQNEIVVYATDVSSNKISSRQAMFELRTCILPLHPVVIGPCIFSTSFGRESVTNNLARPPAGDTLVLYPTATRQTVSLTWSDHGELDRG